MFAIIGIVVVFGAIVAGYLMEHGNLLVLMQPAELVIIFGAAVGTVLIGNPLAVVIKMMKGIGGVFVMSMLHVDEQARSADGEASTSISAFGVARATISGAPLSADAHGSRGGCRYTSAIV